MDNDVPTNPNEDNKKNVDGTSEKKERQHQEKGNGEDDSEAVSKESYIKNEDEDKNICSAEQEEKNQVKQETLSARDVGFQGNNSKISANEFIAQKIQQIFMGSNKIADRDIAIEFHTISQAAVNPSLMTERAVRKATQDFSSGFHIIYCPDFHLGDALSSIWLKRMNDKAPISVPSFNLDEEDISHYLLKTIVERGITQGKRNLLMSMTDDSSLNSHYLHGIRSEHRALIEKLIKNDMTFVLIIQCQPSEAPEIGSVFDNSSSVTMLHEGFDLDWVRALESMLEERLDSVITYQTLLKECRIQKGKSIDELSGHYSGSGQLPISYAQEIFDQLDSSEMIEAKNALSRFVNLFIAAFLPDLTQSDFQHTAKVLFQAAVDNDLFDLSKNTKEEISYLSWSPGSFMILQRQKLLDVYTNERGVRCVGTKDAAIKAALNDLFQDNIFITQPLHFALFSTSLFFQLGLEIDQLIDIAAILVDQHQQDPNSGIFDAFACAAEVFVEETKNTKKMIRRASAAVIACITSRRSKLSIDDKESLSVANALLHAFNLALQPNQNLALLREVARSNTNMVQLQWLLEKALPMFRGSSFDSAQRQSLLKAFVIKKPSIVSQVLLENILSLEGISTASAGGSFSKNLQEALINTLLTESLNANETFDQTENIPLVGKLPVDLRSKLFFFLFSDTQVEIVGTKDRNFFQENQVTHSSLLCVFLCVFWLSELGSGNQDDREKLNWFYENFKYTLGGKEKLKKYVGYVKLVRSILRNTKEVLREEKVKVNKSIVAANQLLDVSALFNSINMSNECFTSS